MFLLLQISSPVLVGIHLNPSPMKAMSKSFLLILFAMAVSMAVTAAKWRVNNGGVPADFTTIQAVVNSSSVAAGDTVYLESSVTSYGDLTTTKKLILIGPGYFLGENDSTQANKASATIGTAVFNTGSEGSVATGILFAGTLYPYTNNLLFKRNMINQMFCSSNASNVAIIQNYISMLYIYDGSQNIIVANNIFSVTTNGGYSLYMSPFSSATITNNIFQDNQLVYNSTYRNNIATAPAGYGRDSFTSSNSTIENNIGSTTQYSTYTGNLSNTDMSTVFACWSDCTGYSTDGRWILKTGSPAIAYGYGGVDCGVYGGATPYVKSGLPTVPAIWLLDVNGLNVTVKAKTH
jgi:hypothetical protein